MHSNLLKSLLENYKIAHNLETDFKNKMLQLLENEVDCFSRSLLAGHFTGSAFIINFNKTKTLLVRHAKLNRWLQPGGHCDGDPDVAAVALKEAEEETGLKNFKFAKNEIFDLDIHTIPEHKGVPEHLHYDIRFLLIGDENERIQISNESTDIQWVELNKIEEYTKEESLLRMVRKL